jgi:hypothetical protein
VNSSTLPATASVASEESSALVIYNTACRALAEAVSVDEVKTIRDKAVAMPPARRSARSLIAVAASMSLRSFACSGATSPHFAMIVRSDSSARLTATQRAQATGSISRPRLPLSVASSRHDPNWCRA